MAVDDAMHDGHGDVGESVPARLLDNLELGPCVEVDEYEDDRLGFAVDFEGLLPQFLLVPCLIVETQDRFGERGRVNLAELTKARRLVLGTSGVPVGRYARKALATADSLVRPGFQDAVLERLVSEEPNVRLARAKVELGEADAAIVYRTDAAHAAGKPLDTDYILEEVEQTRPLSVVMQERIMALREWAAGRTVPCD